MLVDRRDISDTPAPRPTWRRAATIVLWLAIAVRLAHLSCVPLIVAVDSAFYLDAAETLAAGAWPDFPAFRTPGYSLFLAGLFFLCGSGPVVVLVAQHALGVVGAVVVARTAGALAGFWPALVLGAAYALDPWLLSFESFALTEALATTLIVVAAAAALQSPRRGMLVVVAGVALGLACLTRPALQVAVPCVLLAAGLQAGRTWFARGRWVVGGAAAFAITVAPWLACNAQRDIRGFAGAGEKLYWGALTRLDLLPPEALPDNELGRTVRPLLPGAVRNEVGYGVIGAAIADTPGGSARLAEIAIDYARAHPGVYLRAAAYALAWQCNIFPASGPYQDNELRLLSWHTLRDVSNFGNGAERERYAMPPARGLVREVMRLVIYHLPPGMPQVPLFAVALVAVGVGLWRRQWGAALLWLAPWAIVAAHVALLLPFGRYAMPAWAMCYLAPAALVALWRGQETRRAAV